MNIRVVATGAVLIVLAITFFLGMQTMAARSNDPVVMMQTVGIVAGGVGALGLVMLLFGTLRRRR